LEDLASSSPLTGLAGLWESKAPLKQTQATADNVAVVFAPFSQKSGGNCCCSLMNFNFID
ncbi:MAG: hypothetical protein ACK56I_09865, partial [bacterium]